jgi:hypothetical protein
VALWFWETDVKFAKYLGVAAIVFGAATSAHANSVINGSFEADIQAAGTWNIYSNLTGWTGGPYGIELRNNVAGTAYDGVNFIELDTTHNSAATQGISTTLGQLYNLSFAYAPRVGVPASSNGIEVFWDNVSLGTYTGDGNVSSAWTVFTLLVAGTGLDSLKFAAVGTDDSYGGSLDFVSLNAAPPAETSATPLPAALPLFASGLGALGLVGWRRKRKAVLAG